MAQRDNNGRIVLMRCLAGLCLSAILVLMMSFSGHAKEDTSVVRVGYYENEVFQEGASKGQVKTGYAYEYYRKLSEYTGWKYEYVYGGFNELYQKLLDGEIDLLAGLAYREDREGLIGYPDAVMGRESYYLIGHEEDTDIAADPATLNGRTIGVLDSAMVDVLKNYLKEHEIHATIVTYPDHEQMYSDFDTHAVDILAAESDGTYGREHTVLLFSFGSSEYYLCVNASRPDLLDQLNTAQTQLAAEEPNYINSLSARYYSVSVTAKHLSAAEREWVSSHETIHVGYLEDYLPFSDTDAQGQVTGLIKDYIPELLKATGISHMNAVYTGYSSYDEMISALNSGEVDTAFPVGGGLYYSEESGIYQSQAVTSAPTELVYKGAFSEETVRSFAVNEKNRMQLYYVQTNYPEAEITFYPSIDDCLMAVLSGEVSTTTLNGLRANDILRNSRYDGLSLYQASRSDDRCFGVVIGNEGLLKLLNRGINILGSDYAQNISYRYTGGLYEYSVIDMIREHMVLFGSIILTTALLVILLLMRDSRNKKNLLKEKEAGQTTLKAKNAELEESRAALAQTDEIIGEAGFGIWQIELEDGKAPRMRGNAKMQELLGIEGKELTEEEFYDAWYSRILPEEIPSVQKSVSEMLAGERSENTYRWEHPALGILYVRCGGTAAVLEPHHQLLRGYHSDVTEIVREDTLQQKNLSDALAAAEHANKAKTTFLNNMSHDIRTPMNAIVGFTTLAATHIDDRDQVLDYLDKISVSSQHLLLLINDVLDMSRIESGKMTLKESEVHLPDLICDLQTIFQANISSKQLGLDVDIKGVVHEDIIADKLRLNQVLLNLLSNAIKFTPSGGTITFCVTEKPSSEVDQADFEFRIRDTGIGMSEEFQKTIFEAFTREKTSTVSGIQGTGLGMAITKSIVDMMGGEISMTSAEGEGTEFVVNIPCRLSERAGQSMPAAQQEKVDFTGKRILLAEDNEMNQMIAEAILTEAGFEVDIAPDGDVAVRKVSEAPAGTYDVILMDIQMPEMDGYEAAEKIRQLEDPQKAEIPIVAVTANAFEEDRKQALKAGMDAHLAKPYDIPAMMQTLTDLL